MNESPLILSRSAAPSFPTHVAVYLREQAALVESSPRAENPSPGWIRHLATVRSLAEYVAALAPWDQRLRAIWAAQRSTASEYRPGEVQRRLLALAGLDGPVSGDPGEVLAELAAAAVDDLVSAARGDSVGVERRLEVAEKELGKLRGAEERLRVAEAQRADSKARLEELRGALARAERERDHFQLVAGDGGGRVEQPRRKGVEGQPHVFQRTAASGEVVYEVSFSELVDGKEKRRWRTVGTDLEQALALRDELHSAVAS